MWQIKVGNWVSFQIRCTYFDYFNFPLWDFLRTQCTACTLYLFDLFFALASFTFFLLLESFCVVFVFSSHSFLWFCFKCNSHRICWWRTSYVHLLSAFFLFKNYFANETKLNKLNCLLCGFQSYKNLLIVDSFITSKEINSQKNTSIFSFSLYLFIVSDWNMKRKHNLKNPGRFPIVIQMVIWVDRN